MEDLECATNYGGARKGTRTSFLAGRKGVGHRCTDESVGYNVADEECHQSLCVPLAWAQGGAAVAKVPKGDSGEKEELRL